MIKDDETRKDMTDQKSSLAAPLARANIDLLISWAQGDFDGRQWSAAANYLGQACAMAWPRGTGFDPERARILSIWRQWQSKKDQVELDPPIMGQMTDDPLSFFMMSGLLNHMMDYRSLQSVTHAFGLPGPSANTLIAMAGSSNQDLFCDMAQQKVFEKKTLDYKVWMRAINHWREKSMLAVMDLGDRVVARNPDEPLAKLWLHFQPTWMALILSRAAAEVAFDAPNAVLDRVWHNPKFDQGIERFFYNQESKENQDAAEWVKKRLALLQAQTIRQEIDDQLNDQTTKKPSAKTKKM